MGTDEDGMELSAGLSQSLAIPDDALDAIEDSAVQVDTMLSVPDRAHGTRLETVLAHHRETSLASGARIRKHLDLDRLSNLDITYVLWPRSLFIPTDAEWRNFWFTPPPDQNRYGLEWTSGEPNTASRRDGRCWAYQVLRPNQRKASAYAGVGVFYTPTMSLGVVSLQPQVRCQGTLRWFLNTLPELPMAGHVRIRSELQLAIWHVIPGGFDLVDWRRVNVSERRIDQSHGNELAAYSRSFQGSDVATSFLVQGGRRYLLGVVAQVSLSSTLTTNSGEPLPAASVGADRFRLWADLGATVSQIEVTTKQVHIP